MIQYLLGVPGAGKSYYAVDKIFNYVKKDSYKKIYTNIDKFDFSFSSKVVLFEYDEFYRNIVLLYAIYKDKTTNDDDLISKLKDLNYYESIFIIDESHNYFDTLDPVLTWLFSYHRHLYIDFLLITQNLALIETKYKKFAEYFIRAVPSSLNLFNHNFTYKKYIDSRLSQKSYFGKETVKKDKFIFDLYHSGDSVKAPNIIRKYLLWFFLGSILVAIMFKLTINYFKGDINENKVIPQKIIQRDSMPLSSDTSSDIRRRYKQVSKVNTDTNFGLYYFPLSCFDNICSFNSVSFPLDILYPLLKSSNSKVLKIDNINDNYTKVYILYSKKFKKYFIKGSNYEKNIRSVSDSLFSTPSKQ